jgi:hypothetical protein
MSKAVSARFSDVTVLPFVRFDHKASRAEPIRHRAKAACSLTHHKPSTPGDQVRKDKRNRRRAKLRQARAGQLMRRQP